MTVEPGQILPGSNYLMIKRSNNTNHNSLHASIEHRLGRLVPGGRVSAPRRGGGIDEAYSKQIYFRHFFAKLFRHFSYSFCGSSAHIGIGEAANRSDC